MTQNRHPSLLPQALFGGEATAKFELPFLLSIDNEAADDPQAQGAFAALLNDLFNEPVAPAIKASALDQNARAYLQSRQPYSSGLNLQGPSTAMHAQTSGAGRQFEVSSISDDGTTSAGAAAVASGMMPAAQQQSQLIQQYSSDHGQWPSVPSTAVPHALAPAPAGPTPQQRTASYLQKAEPSKSHDSESPRSGHSKKLVTRGSNSGSDSGSKGTGNKPSAAERRAAVQKRYREKKESAVQGLHEQAERQLAALAILEQEHSQLVGKHQALEKLVMCRDEQIQVLARVRGLCKHSSLTAPSQWPAGPAPAQQLKQEAQGCWGPDCALPVELSGMDELMQFKNMTIEQLRNVWLSFVNQASQLLAQMALPGGDAHVAGAVKGLEKLVHEVGQTMKRAIQLNCPIVYMLMQLNLETGSPSVASDALWSGVLKLLELSPGQTLEATCMFQLYCQLMEKVLEERRLLKMGLAAVTAGDHITPPSPAAAGAAPAAGGSGLSSGGDASSQQAADLPPYMLPPGACCMDEMSCAEQLYLNLHKERSTRCLLCCFFFGKLLTPMQLAKMAVASHPFFPDPLGICRQLSATNN